MHLNALLASYSAYCGHTICISNFSRNSKQLRICSWYTTPKFKMEPTYSRGPISGCKLKFRSVHFWSGSKLGMRLVCWRPCTGLQISMRLVFILTCLPGSSRCSFLSRLATKNNILRYVANSQKYWSCITLRQLAGQTVSSRCARSLGLWFPKSKFSSHPPQFYAVRSHTTSKLPALLNFLSA